MFNLVGAQSREKRGFIGGWAWAVFGLVSSGAALAAMAAEEPTGGEGAIVTLKGRLEEIVVTARKVQEQLQQVPISITALTEQEIQQNDIVSLDQLRDLVPNLDVGVTAGSTTATNIYIRGVGTYDYQIYTDAPVTTYIDGVLNARPDSTLFEIADLERVEVLRGPQGTLFGRNTTGGAISLITKPPSDHTGVEQRLAYGTNQDFTSRTILDTGLLGDSGFKAKLIFTHHQRDGYVTNLDPEANGGDPGSLDTSALFFALHGDMGKFHLDYRADYTDHKAQEPFSQTIVTTSDIYNYFSRSPSFGGDPYNYNPDVRMSSAYAGGQPADHSVFTGHALTLQYDFNHALSIKDILAYRSTSVNEYINISGQGNLLGLLLDPATSTTSVGAVTPFNLPENVSHDHQVTNELQLLGESGSFHYVGGLYYFYEKGSLWNPNDFTFVLPGGLLGINQQILRNVPFLLTHSYAAYGQVSWKPAQLDKLELSVGGRYTHDEKEINEASSFSGTPTVVRDDSHSWQNFSGLFSASYQFTDDIMAYARVSNAYRAGGFVPNTYGSYDPEKALSYEAGMKSDWLNRRLRMNLSIFKTNYNDLQVQNTINGLPVITNAGKATYTGGELEITAVPVDGLQLEANIGYVDPKYQEYLLVAPDGTYQNVADQAQFAGVSKVNANVAAQYSFAPARYGNLTGRIDCSYRSHKVWFPLDSQNPFNEVIATKPHENLRARVTLDDIPTGARFKLRAEVYGENLLNEKVVAAGNDFGSLGFGTVVYEQMLTVGVALTADF
jgi:iron complex outermembrane recepter protein